MFDLLNRAARRHCFNTKIPSCHVTANLYQARRQSLIIRASHSNYSTRSPTSKPFKIAHLYQNR